MHPVNRPWGVAHGSRPRVFGVAPDMRSPRFLVMTCARCLQAHSHGRMEAVKTLPPALELPSARRLGVAWARNTAVCPPYTSASRGRAQAR